MCLLKLEANDEGDHKRISIEYDSQTSCAKAIAEMNNKKLQGKYQIRVVQSSSNTAANSTVNDAAQTSKSLRETIGERIYPIALELYKPHAGKICGMVVDSLIKLNDKKMIKLDEILSSQSTLVDLVHEANKKLNSS